MEFQLPSSTSSEINRLCSRMTFPQPQLQSYEGCSLEKQKRGNVKFNSVSVSKAKKGPCGILKGQRSQIVYLNGDFALKAISQRLFIISSVRSTSGWVTSDSKA